MRKNRNGEAKFTFDSDGRAFRLFAQRIGQFDRVVDGLVDLQAVSVACFDLLFTNVSLSFVLCVSSPISELLIERWFELDKLLSLRFGLSTDAHILDDHRQIVRQNLWFGWLRING